MKNTVKRTMDVLAAVVLIAAVGVVLVVIFSMLTITLGWLIIPVLLIVGALAWAAYRGWMNEDR